MLITALIVGFLLTFGIFLAAITVSMRDGLQANRAEVRRLTEEFERIGHRLGGEEES